MEVFNATKAKIPVFFLRQPTKWKENNRFSVYRDFVIFTVYDKKNNEAVILSPNSLKVYKVKNVNINNINNFSSYASSKSFLYACKTKDEKQYEANKNPYSIPSVSESDLFKDPKYKILEGKLLVNFDDYIISTDKSGRKRLLNRIIRHEKNISNNDNFFLFRFSDLLVTGQEHYVRFDKNNGKIKSVDGFETVPSTNSIDFKNKSAPKKYTSIEIGEKVHEKFKNFLIDYLPSRSNVRALSRDFLKLYFNSTTDIIPNELINSNENSFVNKLNTFDHGVRWNKDFIDFIFHKNLLPVTRKIIKSIFCG